jgi:hypothetical protein
MIVIPKMRVHLGVIGLNLLHSPSFVRMCFTFEHTFLAHMPLHPTFSHEHDVRVVIDN